MNRLELKGQVFVFWLLAIRTSKFKDLTPLRCAL